MKIGDAIVLPSLSRRELKQISIRARITSSETDGKWSVAFTKLADSANEVLSLMNEYNKNRPTGT
jgi:hypothetical protein